MSGYDEKEPGPQKCDGGLLIPEENKAAHVRTEAFNPAVSAGASAADSAAISVTVTSQSKVSVGPSAADSAVCVGPQGQGSPLQCAASGIRVRPMTAEDLQNVWQLEKQCFSDAWSMKLLAEAMANDYDYFWVAECAGVPEDSAAGLRGEAAARPSDGPCAVASAHPSGGPHGAASVACFCGYANLRVLAGEGEIERIAVVPAMRRRGVGRKLMEALAAFASAAGVGDMTLEVRAGNLAARKLYESFGFAGEGRRKEYYRNPTEDALIMWRRGV